MTEVFLHELGVDATFGEIAGLPGLYEITAQILMHGGDYSDDAGE